MKVSLLRHTSDPEMTVALASRLCYSPIGVAELEERWSIKEASKLVAKVMKLGHYSVLEHASFTFAIEGISRAASHQLVRHRIASYSQQSQRYVKMKESFEYILPESIGDDEKLRKKFKSQMARAGKLYREFVEAGVPAEDARFLLPNAAATKIIVTMNARELRHFFTLRCCRRAQWEIRGMAEVMLGEARNAAALLFKEAGPGCVRGKCPEGVMTCGLAKEVRKSYRDWPAGSPRPLLKSRP